MTAVMDIWFTYAGLSHYPGKAQEEHDAPNAHHVADENTFDPSEFVTSRAFLKHVVIFFGIFLSWLIIAMP